jgi:hypothetical protein
LVNAGKAHLNHHFGLHDAFAIAAALSFTRNGPMASQGIRILNAAMSIHGLCAKPQRLPVIFSSFF